MRKLLVILALFALLVAALSFSTATSSAGTVIITGQQEGFSGGGDSPDQCTGTMTSNSPDCGGIICNYARWVPPGYNALCDRYAWAQAVISTAGVDGCVDFAFSYGEYRTFCSNVSNFWIYDWHPPLNPILSVYNNTNHWVYVQGYAIS